MVGEFKFIDTNILVYAEQSNEKLKHDKAAEIMSALLKSNEGVLSNQILAELSSVLSDYGFDAGRRNELISTYNKALKTINYSIEDVILANVFSEETGAHFFDSLIAATMKRNNITTIVTENERDFSKFNWLKVENPFKDG
ncbi:hypothetical protein COT30_04265 [Candidatus Micrarchaeota archaeon CG08_land_8_20_14_0_20_49_17]|nr:MAG: hypothetical protein AUJ13_01075 [Candidatus Micrarchaeota archaeon CG1_02_49_24]PIU09450.1 MAG: hypothetical protein COT30_04265 [Candidatus Micrarchaeota archaeon CG08_land_8_20_14_0_20_49_17]PIU81220.1 MAG: hypothetical protein COS70_05205 [Candidatus Micrarchaeota archaeon CG06_land_8_20_14_3_00_50_6]PIZ94180.1 MAG: hypothetical protein COX84_05365 [Candidatus Micrarchaeota archaeon CG_4_10_14_0_2_um_filter_49_7]HII54105.1 PIN domain-containing protein [Candidatus Micrarchaeota arch